MTEIPSNPHGAASALILGIESSCDETAAAIVRADAFGTTVLSNVIASQNDLHAEYRGVVPEIASRAHAERLLPIVRQALAEAGVTMRYLNAVAVGNRPGLIGCLLVGVSGAKALAWALGVPFVGVDHVQAHLFAPWLIAMEPPIRPDARESGVACPLLLSGHGSASGQSHSGANAPHSERGEIRRPHSESGATRNARFPAIGLVVSGGHTALYRCDSPTRVRRIGSTIDDAVGEAYDKAAAVLGLAFPGGPEVDRLAQTGNPGAIQLPVSRLGPDSLDFSFSGLKTALLYAAKGVPARPAHTSRKPAPAMEEGAESTPAPLAVAPSGLSHADLAASFQAAAMQAVMIKVNRALEQHPDCRTLLVGGGVSANSRLRAELLQLAAETARTARAIDVRIPPMEYCLDNAAMIAGLGWHVLRERNWVGDDLSMSADPTSLIEVERG